MKKSRGVNIEENLYAIAKFQNGYFTPRQAIKAGYIRRNFGYYLKKGKWLKMAHGVYRLKMFPNSDDEQYTIYSLWIGENDDVPIGVYSHLTALSYHEIAEIIPSQLHMTVPKNYRTTKEIPKVLKLYKGNLDDKDIIRVRGYSVTTPEKTLLDIAQIGTMEHEHFAESISEGLKKGLITKDFILDNAVFYPTIPYLKQLML